MAHRLKVSQEQVRRLIRDGRLQALRLVGTGQPSRWRIDPADLRAFVARRGTR